MSSDPERRTGQAYLLFAACLLLLLSVGVALQAWSLRRGMVATQILLILLPAVLFVHRKGLPIAHALRWRRISAACGLLSVAIGFGVWAVGVLIDRGMSALLGEGPRVTGLESHSAPELLFALFVFALLPGVCEEALFRGAIQGVLERRGALRAVAVTGVLFGLFHVSPWTIPSATFLGLVFGILVIRTGSIVPAMLAHAANNTISLTVAFLVSKWAERTTYPPALLSAAVAVFAVSAVLYWRMTRGAAVPPSPLASVPAALGRGVKAAVMAAAGLLVAILVLFGVALVLIAPRFDFRKVPTADLDPDLQQGDLIVLAKPERGGRLNLRQGDIVSFREDGKSSLARVVRVAPDRVWLHLSGRDVEVTRDLVTGKVIYPEPRR